MSWKIVKHNKVNLMFATFCNNYVYTFPKTWRSYKVGNEGMHLMITLTILRICEGLFHARDSPSRNDQIFCKNNIGKNILTVNYAKQTWTNAASTESHSLSLSAYMYDMQICIHMYANTYVYVCVCIISSHKMHWYLNALCIYAVIHSFNPHNPPS